ncbi:hypothetical protein J1777_07270 [Comamonas denitrificans]|uniref:Uncharacterized protein n=1 Tax=Comamonas denitrificans TaxID=117506 RepID=A0A939KDG0_9BURK|nr:hypothetical protein [Comamonas denitrificans]MBO1249631.1 hypothetical protein [Comamonas denitrificans]
MQQVAANGRKNVNAMLPLPISAVSSELHVIPHIPRDPVPHEVAANFLKILISSKGQSLHFYPGSL